MVVDDTFSDPGNPESFLNTVPPEEENPTVLAVPSLVNSMVILPTPLIGSNKLGSPGKFVKVKTMFVLALSL